MTRGGGVMGIRYEGRVMAEEDFFEPEGRERDECAKDVEFRHGNPLGVGPFGWN